MIMNIFFLLQFIVLYVSVESQGSYEIPPYGYKTAYNQSYTQEERELLLSTDSYVPDVCTPIHLSTFLRHGSRYPTATEIVNMKIIEDRVRGKVTNPLYAALNDTYLSFDDNDGGSLAEVGVQEMHEISHRWVSRFHSLIAESSPGEKIYYSSSLERNMESCEAFQDGLSISLGLNMTQSYQIRDDITIHGITCPFYNECFVRNATINEEYITFITGHEMTNLAKELTAKLQMTDDVFFSIGDIVLIWKIAASQYMIEGISPWADLFTWEEKDMPQYTEDLSDYLLTGYAYPYGYEISCIVLSDMMRHIDNSHLAHHSGQESWIKAVFRIGHGITMKALQSLLGLYEDDVPLRADNYEHQQYNRVFRSDRNSPMSGSVTMALYACDTEADWSNTPPPGVEWPDILQPYMVQLLINELPTKFPVCDTHLCEYDFIRDYYDRYVAGCNHKEMCYFDGTC